MKKLATNKSVEVPREVINAITNGILIIVYVSAIQCGWV